MLLGPPGSGKTTVFKHESERQGGIFLTVRDFLTFKEKPEQHDKILFIDGLDESRAGKADGRTPLDSIRAKLDRMGRPRFRLSCREADWFGANDSINLKTVSPDETVTVLRLEPLSGQDIHRILTAAAAIDDPENFISSAQDRDVQGLLANPQSLKMLAAAVGAQGDWPVSRKQTFNMACRTLLREHNDDHRIAQPDSSGISDLMHASGKLCAILLLTGADGYTLSAEDSDNRFLKLDDIPGQNQTMLRSCLRSKLFETQTQRRAVPVHRQTAEFLAAGYLAGLIDEGLPVGRILALITWHDSAVVSALRGLSAWLAAHSKSSRAEVIRRDPLGTVLYGDARDFSQSEKRALLEGLRRETAANPQFILTLQLDSRLGDLISPDMEQHYREILTAPSREDSQQSFIAILVEAFRYGVSVPGLADPLMKLLRDETRWPRIRHRAIEAFLRQRKNDAGASAELKALTDDVFTGEVPDPDDSLLCRLLSTLYPAIISETEIMRYLRFRRIPGNYLYKYFWTEQLFKKSTTDQLVVLLDQFAERCDSLSLKDSAHGFSFNASLIDSLSSKLLIGFLELPGAEADLTLLFNRLGSAAYAGGLEFRRHGGQQFRVIREWLEDRPSTWKALLAMGLKRCIGQPECAQQYGFTSCMYKEQKGRLFGAAPPPDFGLWCLDQAIVAENAAAADWLLGKTAKYLRYGRSSNDLSREVVLRRLAGYAGLKHIFTRKISEFEVRAPDGNASGNGRRTQLEALQPNWHDEVKPLEDDLFGNRADPALLHELAVVYFGGYIDVQGSSPRERLNALLAGDSSLVEAVLFSFRKTMERKELPSDREIIRLGTSKRTHFLALPFMAGMEEISETALFDEMDVDEKFLRLALAVHYTVPIQLAGRIPADRPPRWFDCLLSRRPDLVADVLSRSVLSQLRNGTESPAGLYKLKFEDHADVARIAAIPLLKRFPKRCRSSQLSSLRRLFLAARRYCDAEQLLELIDEKQALPNMNVAQRIHWLAAGLCIAPDTYVDRLNDYVSATERRIGFLAEAVSWQSGRSPDLQCHQSVPALQLLIRLLIRLIGFSCRPFSFKEPSFATPEIIAADQVKVFIERLSAILTEDASRALESLSSDDDLRPWHTLLKNAAYKQRALRREAEFVYSDTSQVLDTLKNGKPANAADLAALTFEHLRQIARDIRDGNMSDWRQYWNIRGQKTPLNTRPENVCRDALLSDLRTKLLRLGIEAEAEARCADDSRVDIRVSHRQYNVPIEIKKSCDRHLWSAIRSQLIPRYIRDPGTEGHGIYLVFWFGNTEDCRPTPPATGYSPRDSQELEKRLTATLSVDEQRKIKICVIDVAAP